MVALAILLVVGVAGVTSWWLRPGAPRWTTLRLSEPARTEVHDAAGALLAELTDGARTVPIAGPSRSWGEPGLATVVTGDRWVRLLPAPYDGVFDESDERWLQSALADRSPDVLAIAFQYATGVRPMLEDRVQIAGDAAYGPDLGADFNDYLGIAWTYSTGIDKPEPEEYRALDCSGFVRMVLGYRLGIAMSIDPADGTIPRRAKDQLGSGPGRVLVANSGRQVTSFAMIRPGDLVFFDASDRDGDLIDHNGIFLGRDTGGSYRFISSRQKADGPSIGDVGGASILDGTGYWAQTFRAIRRV